MRAPLAHGHCWRGERRDVCVPRTAFPAVQISHVRAGGPGGVGFVRHGRPGRRCRFHTPGLVGTAVRGPPATARMADSAGFTFQSCSGEKRGLKRRFVCDERLRFCRPETARWVLACGAGCIFPGRQGAAWGQHVASPRRVARPPAPYPAGPSLWGFPARAVVAGGVGDMPAPVRRRRWGRTSG